ncbi:MAG: hypothetical protein JWN03_3082 [Nocardia sp.]|nr:hypothetical protein [Nocardia sp.]
MGTLGASNVNYDFPGLWYPRMEQRAGHRGPRSRTGPPETFDSVTLSR